MKRWTIETITDDNGVITITGTSHNRRSNEQFAITMLRNQNEQDAMAIHRGRVLTNYGCSAAKALTIMSHLAATDQFKTGVEIVV